jgi:hypothetical protein
MFQPYLGENLGRYIERVEQKYWLKPMIINEGNKRGSTDVKK